MNEVLKGDYLFVYGTLRRGERADLSRNKEKVDFCLGEDRINGRMYSVGWYPGVKAMPSRKFDTQSPTVIGDVFRIRDVSIMPLLDAYEGYPTLFTRIQTKTETGRKVWLYVYNHQVREDQEVGDGDWRKRVTETNSTPSAI